MEQRDKLGRRLAKFDRHTAALKAAKTRKEKYGDDFYPRIGSIGGRSRKRGHFGNLKDQGKTEEIKNLAKKGWDKAFGNPEKKSNASKKGWETRKSDPTNRRTFPGGK